MRTKQVQIETLKLAGYNPRQISNDDMASLVNSIREFGMVEPIVVNRDNTVIGGHQRIVACKQLSIAKVPVVYVDLPKKKEKILNLALNRIHGDWDTEKLAVVLEELKMNDGNDLHLTGFQLEEIGEILDSQIEDDGSGDDFDAQAEAQKIKKPKSKRGQVYQLGRHRLMCGDATSKQDVEKLMEGKKADCIFTSPPYAVGANYPSYSDTLENLRILLNYGAQHWNQNIVSGGFVVLNFGDIASAQEILKTNNPCEYPMALEYWPIFRKHGFVLWSRRIWCKPNPRVHSPQCIGSNRAATDWEHIWSWKTSGDPIRVRVDGESCLGWIDTTHEKGVEIGKEIHVAGMAVSIAQRMVKIHSRLGRSVYDPFGGSGTTLIAAEKTDRICHMMEIDPVYVDVIRKRYKEYVSQKLTD